MSKPITITNPNVIEFFENNEIYEPNLLFSVLIKQFVDNNSSQQQQNTPSIDKQILISKEELGMFYEEYKFFLNQKATVVGIMKEAYRESHCNLNRVKFNNLDNFFTRHLNIKKASFICDICGVFTVSTKKGLITHKRKCSKMNEKKKDDEEDGEDGEEYDDDGEDEDIN